MYGFGERLRAMRTARGISQSALAEEMEVSRSAIAMWEGDQREPSLEMLTRLAAALHTTPDALLAPATAAPVLTQIHTRRVPLMTAGEPVLPAADAPLVPAAETDCDLALHITDDSMAPTLLCGDTLYLRTADATDGCIAAVVIDGRIFVKRIYRTGESCTLLSDNPRIPPVTLPAPSVLGIATAYRRPLR